MYRPIRFVMVAALVAGLSGPALAQDPDDEWRDDRDGRQEERWRDDDRTYDRNDRRYDERWRGDRDRGYRDGRRGGAGYGAVSPWRIRQARQELRRIQWMAMRDGVITRWERLRIQQARQRLAWLMQRAHGRYSL